MKIRVIALSDFEIDSLKVKSGEVVSISERQALILQQKQAIRILNQEKEDRGKAYQWR